MLTPQSINVIRFALLCLLSLCNRVQASDATDCVAVFDHFDRLVARAHVRDVQETLVRGFPPLRANRLLASLAREAATPAERREWIERSARLGLTAMGAERANLSAAYRSESGPLDECAARNIARYLEDADLQERILAHVRPPADYSRLDRVFGLYWLTRHLAMPGIRKWHDAARREFRDTVDETHEYVPPLPMTESDRPGEVLPRAMARGALGVPLLTPDEQESLLRQFAPALAVASNREFDQPGGVTFTEGEPAIRQGDPAAYTYVTFARFGDLFLTQLNYLFWFSERPREGRFDPYAGHLDGVIWRATLLPDGRVLLFESVHACGCYHVFYPVDPHLSVRPPQRHQEPPLVLRANLPEQVTQVTVQLASGTHFVTALAPATPRPEPVAGEKSPVGRYRLQPYSDLRSIQNGDRHTSLFDERGLVPSSRRLERWFYWPLGVPSAGTMRQRGHQLTAFVGRRVFDDPEMLARIFQWPGDKLPTRDWPTGSPPR